MPYFSKYPIPENFHFVPKVNFKADYSLFASPIAQVQLSFFEHDVVALRINDAQNTLPQHSVFQMPINKINARLHSENGKEYFEFGDYTLVCSTHPFTLKLLKDGIPFLESQSAFLGFNGEKIIFQFQKQLNQPFWGFGSKTGPLNKESRAMKMWNTDVVGDMEDSAERNDYDPGYVSIPFFITKVKTQFVGVFLDNPSQTFFNTGKDTNFQKSGPGSKYDSRFYFGSYTGESTLYFLPGNSIAQIVERFTLMTGRHTLPPRWALGHHQCRWSYMSSDEVLEVVQQYEAHQLPLDALWLDIDYMDDYKVFTWDSENFPDPERLCTTLHDRGLHVVSILDPGVKQEPGYRVYEEGKQKDLFCKNPNGGEFVGQVWPGETVFPDFTLEETKQWWAQNVAQFADGTVDGLWIDMNDPATGGVEPEDMLFQRGTAEHHFYRNQYANEMAKATLRGLQLSNKNRRTFILTRSACTEIQKYAAVWTGDNVSSWEHLALSIPQTLNLSLSGVAFSGPDVGGFMKNTTEQLIVRWYQAGFAFPFFRNHSSFFSEHQEPYLFSDNAIDTIRRSMNQRYKWLPYIYNLFWEHRVNGTPILRPVFFEFDDPQYYSLEDQFFVGPSILQAPIITPENSRSITLPPGKWFDVLAQQWVDGGRSFIQEVPIQSTPIYFRDGAVIPVFSGNTFHNKDSRDFTAVEFELYIQEKEEVRYTYYEDDGESLSYEKGMYNLYELHIRKEQNGQYSLHVVVIHQQYNRGIHRVECMINRNQRIDFDL